MATPLIITGPPTDKISKEEAEAQLVRHPQFPKNASFALESVEGRWIAAISPKESAPPEAFSDGGGAGDTPDGPPDPEEAPKGPDLEDDGASADVSDGEDKPDDGKGEKKGLEAQVEHLTQLLTLVVDALGLGAGPEDSPVPHPDEGPPPGPPAPGGDDGPQKIRHERSLKPGEAAPGTTPVGAPSFSHVRDDHPWKSILGQKRTFVLEEAIGDQKLADVRAELAGLAGEVAPYRIAQLREDVDGSGQRVARALISV